MARFLKAEIEQARKTDLVAVCKSLGEVLIPHNPEKGEFRLKGGLIIAKNRYWFEDDIFRKLEGQAVNDENNSLNFCIFYYKMPFKNAVKFLTSSNFPIIENSKTQKNPLKIPPKAQDNALIIDYLHKQRGLDEEI